MFSKRLLKSQEGSIVLSALAVAALVAIFSGVIATQVKSTNDISQLPRIRAAMAQIELQARLAAFSSASYLCSYSGADYNCAVNRAEFEKLRVAIDGGVVRIDGLALNDSTKHLSLAVILDRTGAPSDKRLSIAPRVLDLEIPSELLQPVAYSCPDDRPIFAGYFTDTANGHKKGQADCRQVPTRNCGPGRYVASISPTTLEPQCADAGGMQSCAPGEYFSEFSWNNGGTVNFRCATRKDPFTEMGFDYNASTTFDDNYVARDPDTPDPQPPALPGPEIITWTAPNPQPASTCYTPPRVDCVGSFGMCSQPCGGGSQVFSISQPASGGGAACQYSNGAVQQCNMQACPAATATPAPGCHWTRIADVSEKPKFQNVALNFTTRLNESLNRNPFLSLLKSSIGPVRDAGACQVNGPDTACDNGTLDPDGLCFAELFGGPPPGPAGPVGSISTIPGCESSNNGQTVPGIWGNTCTGGNLRDGSTWRCDCAASATPTPAPTAAPTPASSGNCTCVNSELYEFVNCGGNLINGGITQSFTAADAASCTSKSNRCSGTASKLMYGTCTFNGGGGTTTERMQRDYDGFSNGQLMCNRFYLTNWFCDGYSVCSVSNIRYVTNTQAVCNVEADVTHGAYDGFQRRPIAPTVLGFD